MNTAETIIWSAAAGSMGLVVLLGAADALFSRSRASVQSLIYLTACWGFFLLLSGLAATLLPRPDASWLHTAQVLLGPMCGGLGTHGASQWLAAARRDRLTELGFRSASILCLTGGPLCLLLAPGWQLPASAALAILSLSVALWLAVRAAQQGDRLAWGLAAGCLLTLPLQLGLYWLALDTGRPSVLLQTGMQRHTGVVNPAGRYDDRCFVVLIESMHSPDWIRTMGLREASSLRRPLEISALSGERIRISADISVGMVHLTGAGRDVAQLLHEAEEMAMAARGMRSRAALLDEISRQAVPVENAQLGVSWNAMRSVRPHQARNGHGARPRKTPA